MARQQVSVGIRLTADGSQLTGQVRLSKEELAKLGMEFQASGRKATGFSQDTGKATDSTRMFGMGLRTVTGLLGAFGVSLSAVGMARLVNQATEAADRLDKLSISTGITTDDLQRLQFIAGQTGGDFKQLTTAINFFQRQTVNNKDVRAFMDALDIRDLGTVEQIKAIADAFEGITDPAQRAAAAGKLFGEEAGPKMLALLDQGSEGIGRLSDELDGIGKLSEEQIDTAVQFRDAWHAISTAFTNTLSSGVIAALGGQTGGLSDTFEDLRSVLSSEQMRSAITAIVSGIGRVASTAASAVAGLTDLYNVARILSGLRGPTDRGGTEAAREELDLLREYERVQGDIVEAMRQREAVMEQMATVELDIARGAMQQTIDQLDAQIQRMQDDQAAREDQIEALKQARGAFIGQTQAMEVVVRTGGAAGDALDHLTGKARDSGNAQKAAAQESDRFANELERLRRTLDPVYAATQDYIAAVDTLDRAWRDGLISGEQYDAMMWGLASGSEEVTKATERVTEAADPLAVAWKRAVEDVDRAFADLFVSAFNGFEDFADALRNAFTRLLGELAWAAARNRIVIGLGIGGASGTAAASGGMGGLGNIGSLFGAGPAGFLNSLVHGSATGPFQTATGAGMFGGGAMGYGLSGIAGGLIGSQFGGYGGIGGSLGGMAGFGLATGGSAIGASMAGLGALAGPLGAIGGAILGGMLGSLFGSDTPGTQGQRAAWADTLDLSTGAVGARHGGDPVLEGPRDQAIAIVQGLIAGIQGIGGTTSGTLEELGTGYRGGWQVIIDGQMQLFGDDTEALFDRIFDYLIEGTTGVDEAVIALLQSADSLDERLRRLDLLTMFDPVNAMLERIGQTAMELSAGGLDNLESLLGLFGGGDGASNAMAFYYQTMYSESERLAHLAQDVATAFDGLGIAVPETRDELRALVEGLDLTTEAGREAFAALMGLAPALDTLFTEAEQAAQQAIQEAQRAAEEAAREAQRAAEEALAAMREEQAALELFMATLGDAMQLVTDQRGRDPLGDAVGVTATAAYQRQYSELMRLVQAYDGTAESTQQLAVAYGQMQDMTQSLAAALMDTARSVDVLFGSLADRIRQDLIQDEQQLYEYRRDQVDLLVSAMDTMTDPAQIMSAAQEIERLTATMWGSLAEDQQQAMGQGFLDFLDEINVLTQERIAGALATLDEDQRTIGDTIDVAMRIPAEAMRDAAARQQDAANTIAAAAAVMQSAAASINSGAAALNSAASTTASNLSGEVTYV